MLKLIVHYYDEEKTEIYYYEVFVDEFSLGDLVALVRLNSLEPEPDFLEYHAQLLFDEAGEVLANM
jgi:hypothetical protein